MNAGSEDGSVRVNGRNEKKKYKVNEARKRRQRDEWECAPKALIMGIKNKISGTSDKAEKKYRRGRAIDLPQLETQMPSATWHCPIASLSFMSVGYGEPKNRAIGQLGHIHGPWTMEHGAWSILSFFHIYSTVLLKLFAFLRLLLGVSWKHTLVLGRDI